MPLLPAVPLPALVPFAAEEPESAPESSLPEDVSPRAEPPFEECEELSEAVEPDEVEEPLFSVPVPSSQAVRANAATASVAAASSRVRGVRKEAREVVRALPDMAELLDREGEAEAARPGAGSGVLG